MATSINFLIILGPSQKEIRGGGWYWTLFMAAILLTGILTLSTQLATCLSILKGKNTTLYKDLSHKMSKGAGNMSPLSAF